MKTNELQTVSFEDVIFDGRNKAYGAYDIRKHYDVHLKTSLTITLSIFLLLMLSPRIIDYFFPDKPIPEIPVTDCPVGPVIEITDVVLPKPPVNVTPPPSPDIATLTYSTPKVVDRILNPKPLPANQDVLQSDGLIDSKTQSGATTSITQPQKPAADIITDDVKPLIFVEVMPKFTGGDAALYKFISEHVRYPDYGMEYRLEGTVWVQFTVGKDGNISDPKIIQSVRGGFDEEALRIVKMMPAWQPGKQNGREVPVYVKLPIKFTIRN